jgi:hypothetical protein
MGLPARDTELGYADRCSGRVAAMSNAPSQAHGTILPMNIAEARKLLLKAGYEIATEERLPNGTGTAVRLRGGQIVNVFDTGTVNVQGRDVEPVQRLFANADEGATRDGAGNEYIEVDNVRITYVPADRRDAAKNWAGQDVVRIQARRDDGTNALHMGAEFPVDGPAAGLRFIEAFARLIARATP